MGIATHLGPWLLGTVKDTTGTTAGLIRNIGATAVSQSKAIAFGDAASTVAFVLPAGAIIQNFQILATTAFGAGTIVISVGGSAVTGSFTLPTTTVVTPLTGTNGLGSSNPSIVANVGTTDAIVTYTMTSATLGSGILTVAYIVRNADGTTAPTSFTA